MKPFLLTLLISLSAASVPAESGSLADDASAFAQMDSVKKQIIATALDLTPGQCEVFWPLYDAYQQELRLISARRSRLPLLFAGEQESLSEESARDVMNAFLDLETERIALWQSALEKFSEVLPARAVLKFLQLEIKIESNFYADIVKYLSAPPSALPLSEGLTR